MMIQTAMRPQWRCPIPLCTFPKIDGVLRARDGKHVGPTELEGDVSATVSSADTQVEAAVDSGSVVFKNGDVLVLPGYAAHDTVLGEASGDENKLV